MNINRLLKETITQTSLRTLRKPVASVRKELAEVKRQLAALRKKLRSLEKSSGVHSRSAAPESAMAEKKRFRRPTARDVQSLRNKLDLTQAQLGKLMGVSTLTVWKWEHAEGRLDFRKKATEAFRRVRKMNRSEAQKNLQ